MMVDLLRTLFAARAAMLRNAGHDIDTIAAVLRVGIAEADALSFEGGWEPARWPLVVTRVYEDGSAEIIST